MKKILILLTSLILCFSLNLKAEEEKGKVLVIMSNAEKLKLKNNKSIPTGFFLNEFAIPVQELIDAGYEIVVATPKGKKPSMDKSSKDPIFFQNDKRKMDNAMKLADEVLVQSKIEKLSTVADKNLNEYAGVFIPGGHAPMTDLMVDASVGKILEYFHKKGIPTAMICHGPIATIAVMENPAAFRKALTNENQDAAKNLANDWIYKGYDMTIFSTAEEKDAEKNKLKGNVEFYPEDALKAAGANLKNADPKENNVVEDRELITGQNPASDADLARALIKAMNRNHRN